MGWLVGWLVGWSVGRLVGFKLDVWACVYDHVKLIKHRQAEKKVLLDSGKTKKQ